MKKLGHRGSPSLVKMRRKGSRLSIKGLKPHIIKTLSEELTYSHVQHLRGKEAHIAGCNMRTVPVKCFKLIEDPDGIVEPQILTAPGFTDRILKALKRRGVKVDYQDLTKRREEVYEPWWDRIGDISLRWKQRECLERIIANPYGRIRCPTAYGKTFLIAALCRIWPHAKIDISTHSNDVIGMIYDSLLNLLPSVGIVTGKVKRQGERVMCYSGKSIHRSDAKADVLIVDEVHEWATPDYLERAIRYENARCFGLSANKVGDRMDNADFELEGIFGPLLINIEYADAVKNGCISDLKVRWEDVVMDVNPCQDMGDLTQRERWGIWRNYYRNEQIAKVARQYKDQQVLITVSTVEHACHIKKLLPEFNLCYAENGLSTMDRNKYVRWGLIENSEPQMTGERRYKMRKAFEAGTLKRVIATPVWNRGVDFKKLAVLIRGDAKASAIPDTQIPGRLARLSEDKPYGLLVDFIDQFDAGFRRRATERRGRYKKMGWEQIDPHRNYNPYSGDQME